MSAARQAFDRSKPETNTTISFCSASQTDVNDVIFKLDDMNSQTEALKNELEAKSTELAEAEFRYLALDQQLYECRVQLEEQVPTS